MNIEKLYEHEEKIDILNNTIIPNITTNVNSLLNSEIKGNNASKYKIVAGVLRNTGSGWSLLDDDVHTPLNIDHAVNDADSIGIAYTFTAKTVGSVVCVPDETFVQRGYMFGASGGVSVADIVISCNKPISGYVYYDGTNWSILGNSIGVSTASFSNGVLTIEHDETDSLDVGCYAKSGNYLASIENTGANNTKINIKDYNGNLVTTPTTNMGVFFSRGSKKIINPNSVVSTSGNIWVYGIFEI
jgi:hypothetical protein